MHDWQDMSFEATTASAASDLPYIPDTAECMRCGMCVSNCPTFRLFETDEETPRRRIRSMSKVLLENQALDADEHLHLNNCLQCRSCESFCPSHIAYGELFDKTLVKLNAGQPLRWQARLAFWLIEHKRWRNSLLPMLSLYLRSGLQRPLRASGLLHKLQLATVETLLSKPSLTSLSGIHPTSQRKRRGRAALFTGCLAENFDGDTQRAAIKVLNAIGYEVVVPEGQGCCGAIHLHNGRSAQKLIDNNIAAFYALEVEAVLFSSTGCGAMLSQYDNQDAETAGWFQRHTQDINQFLLDHWPENLQLAASNLNVAVHEPCSQRNVLKNSQSVYALLRKIPGLNLEPLPDNHLCCGAGGSYLLTHPENAERLRELKRRAIEGCGADLVVSSNFGCMLHLNVNQPLGSPRTVHPLQLLADRL